MIFKIARAVPIKEFVIRYSIQILEMQGMREVINSEYDVAIDVQPHVDSEEAVDNNGNTFVKLKINGDAIFQEITNAIASLQFTSGVAREMTGAKWVALSEEEKRDAEQEDTGVTEKLSDSV